MQYPYLRTDVFQGFREIGNSILFCLLIETFLVNKSCLDTFSIIKVFKMYFKVLKCQGSLKDDLGDSF